MIEMDMDMGNETLHVGGVIKTVEQLRLRILDRFEDSSLGKVCGTLLKIARRTDARIAWIERPRWGYRILVGIFLIVAVTGLVYAVCCAEIPDDRLGLADLVQMGESALNNLIYIGAAIVFLVSIETRAKRKGS